MNVIKSKIKEWNNNGGLSNEQRNKISKRVSGENNPNAKLSLQDVLKIRELFDTGKFSKKDLSGMFNVDPPAIYKIINRLTWKNI